MQSNIKRALISFCIVIVVFIATGNFAIRPASAAGVWYVKNGGSDSNDCQTPATACANINAALAKPGFVAGDTIRVAVGTYTGTGSEVVLINKDATLSGGWDAATFMTQSGMATIDGQGARRVVEIVSGVSAVIREFIVQNGYQDGGAGILNNGGVLTLTRSVIRGNSTIFSNGFGNGYGGGIMNLGTLTITQSSITNNIAYGGGGISTYSPVLLINSTISSNGAQFGGGLVTNAIEGTVYANNSTITGNSGGTGGGIASNVGQTTYFMRNSIVAGNTSPYGTYAADCHVGFSSLGYSLLGETCGPATSPGDIVTLDPKLGPLTGLPGYHPPLDSSPAIDAGDPDGCQDSQGNLLVTDQRGFARVGRCDIGATEVQQIDFSSKTVSTSSVFRGDTITYTISVRNNSATTLNQVLMTDTLPSSLTFVKDSIIDTAGNSAQSNGMVTWSGTIAGGQIITITFGATINQTVAFGTKITNVATIDAQGMLISRSADTTVVMPINKIFIPQVSLGHDYGIFGYVTINGMPAPGIPLELRFYNGSAWSTLATTNTAGDGEYIFYAPALSSQQRYYVRYLNSTNNTRLSSWGTRQLTSFAGTSDVRIGNFDIANIPLVLPAPGSLVSLPTTFRWGARSATPTDSYEFNLLDYTDGNPWWWTAPLGYVGGYTLNSLPAGFSTGTPYGWSVGVYSPDGGYGQAYYLYVVGFNNTGNAPRPNAPARARPTVEDLPRPKVFNR